MKKHWMIVSLAATAALAGCKKKDDAGGGAADKPADKPSASLPALTAEPDPGAITPAEVAPFEAVKFRMLDKRNTNGWPQFDAYNLGTKKITFLAITGYAYDKDGKQVGRTTVPLSWNGNLAPGGKTDWAVNVGGMHDTVPDTAASYQLCYESVSFEGDAKSTSDSSRCPDQRPKK